MSYVEWALMSGLGGLLLVSALAVIGERNPVHSVFFLVLTFCQSAALLVLRGAEFMAMMFLIVYVGAIAVLFLFVVMMLSTQADRRHTPWIPLGTGVSLILLIQLMGLAPSLPLDTLTHAWGAAGWSQWTGESLGWGALESIQRVTNVEALGLYLYTVGLPYFMLAGVILWISMVGAIALTLHRRAGVKRQDIAFQVARTAENALRLHPNRDL